MRRASDHGDPVADQAAPPTSSPIIVERRRIADRRGRQTAPEPISGFVAHAVAQEGMLLDLRPDPVETLRSRHAYEGAPKRDAPPRSERYDLKV